MLQYLLLCQKCIYHDHICHLVDVLILQNLDMPDQLIDLSLDPLLSLPTSQLDFRFHDLFNSSLLDPALRHNLQLVLCLRNLLRDFRNLDDLLLPLVALTCRRSVPPFAPECAPVERCTKLQRSLLLCAFGRRLVSGFRAVARMCSCKQWTEPS